MSWLQSFFNTPARQAAGWTVLGILGIAMAAGGVFFLTDDGSGPKRAGAGQETPAAATATATPTRTAIPQSSPSATPSPSPSPTQAATVTPTTRAATGASSGSGSSGGSEPSGGSNSQAPEPTPTPTPPPVVAGGAYCPPTNVGPGSLPSGRVAGAVTVGGANVAEGTVTISLAFDGVLGPTVTNVVDAEGKSGFRIDFYANTSECANRVGASISAYANGQFFPTGRAVGDGGGQLIPVTIALP